ncbi:sulfite exporter TauE/SafE family protein [Micrococcus sp.]|uniref:sulfite exporter TauE/SafE family protein n=1 Tax=Micrococcus sp. TaxID=1271 RepID=UPI002A9154A6|nr:sulfite exporter TauE/SafE family protein [Micrococcus sp.]MDY6054278.1 sulfite exporter TauE/SafE family protein [Micrococcus sp.]
MTELLGADVLGLELWQVLLVLAAGFWAGTINSIIGSGTLVTFPVLVSVGLPPVTAQVSNAMGLIASGFSGTWGYRRELAASRHLLPPLALASFLGAVIGASLLTRLPPSVFGYAAPALLVFALTVVVLQPRIQAWVRRRSAEGGAVPGADSPVPVGPVSPTLWTLVFLTGIYGGYFVAAQGVMLMAIFGVLFVGGTLVHANAVKTALALIVNLTAAVYYLVFAFDRIDWRAVVLIAASSLVGGSVGARIGRRISPIALRVTIVAVGLAGLVVMLLRLRGVG